MWIVILEQAENEHMHLLLALELRKPNWLYKMAVTFTQGQIQNTESKV